MKIVIECDCGNSATILAQANKYTQFRDNLAQGGFHLDVSKIKDNKSQEFDIICYKCKKRITLGVD